MLNLLATVLFALTPADSTFFHVDVVNNTKIEKVGGRDITFGVKETVEEYIKILQGLQSLFILILFIHRSKCLTLWAFNG